MKFSNSTLKKFIKGACYYETSNGFLIPFKFCKNQLDLMRSENYDEFWRGRVILQAGVRIELKTNSPYIAFDYRAFEGAPLSARSNSIDIYVNGSLYSVLHLDNDKGKVNIALPEGDKYVTVYYPNDRQLGIKNFSIDGNYKSIKDKGQKVLVIGDSITQGYGPLLSSASYFNELQRLTGYNMLNQGVGGYRCEPQDLMYVEGFVPDKIITFLGTNWYDAPNAYDYETATVGFYKRLTEMYPDTQILSISPIWRCSADYKRFEWCRSIVKRECEKYDNIHFVDGYTLIPKIDECFCDGTHPNEYGCLLIAQNLFKEIKKIKF